KNEDNQGAKSSQPGSATALAEEDVVESVLDKWQVPAVTQVKEQHPLGLSMHPCSLVQMEKKVKLKKGTLSCSSLFQHENCWQASLMSESQGKESPVCSLKQLAIHIMVLLGSPPIFFVDSLDSTINSV
ncbi:hypothetical protein HGM15179_010980, partial [Zosterops borbonicus]